MKFTKVEYKELAPKNYMGLTQGKIVAINPTKEELEALGIKRDKEIEYESTVKAKNIKGEEIETKLVRFDFWLKSDLEEAPLFKLSLSLTKAPAISSTNKVMFIDKYTNYKYVDLSERESFKTDVDHIMTKKDGTVIKDSEGKDKIALFKDSRVAYQGESTLVDFLKEFLQVKDCYVWSNDKQGYCINPNLSSCELSLTDKDFDEIFTNWKTSEVVTLVKSTMVINKVNFIIGVKYVDGKYYNEVLNKVRATSRRNLYSDKVLLDLKTSYDKKLVKFLSENNKLRPLHEVNFNVEVSSKEEVAKATDTNDENNDDLPFF